MHPYIGETDVMYWDSSMTEKGCEDQDLNHKQNHNTTECRYDGGDCL